MNYAEWNGFKGGRWEKEINVAEFVRLNYRPYDGDEKFLAPASASPVKNSLLFVAMILPLRVGS